MFSFIKILNKKFLIHCFVVLIVARSISDDLSSGDAARFRDDEYGKAESGGSCSGTRTESAHKSEKDKDKKEKEKEERDEGEDQKKK